MDITYKYLEDHNFNFDGLSNKPIKDKCHQCLKEFEYKTLKKFLRNRLSLPYKDWCRCQSCFLKFRTIHNNDWIEKNRKAQLVSQNKPEQKLKNAIGVSKSWNTERKQKASQYLKKRWKNDKKFAKKAKNNLKYDNKHIKNTLGIRGLKGIYKDIYYDSALGLSYILWCEEHNIPIKRYDLDPIVYKFNKKQKLYFPDFIIFDYMVIEIKGKRLYFAKNKKQNLAKTKEAIKKLKNKYLIIFDKDKEVKKHYRKARKLHYEIKK